MTSDNLAIQDFELARVKAFWRQIFTWLRGENNELLPYDSVREKIDFRGQYYVGLRQIPIEKIVGSSGRYRDFDRAFLPTQARTRSRWVSIDKAHHQQLILPPVDVYKVGDIYFVRDGNHRVSVARDRGQKYIDAFVTEILVPIQITKEMDIDAIVLEQARTSFLLDTGMNQLRPLACLHASHPDQYLRLREHIDVHRYYLGEQRGGEVGFVEAVVSWYDMVYTPIATMLQEHNILSYLKKLTLTDMYIWVMEFEARLRDAYREPMDKGTPVVSTLDTSFRDIAGAQLEEDYPDGEIRKIRKVLQGSAWLERVFLRQERIAFLRRTQLTKMYPDANIRTTRPGQFDILLEHIRVHRWYLGEQFGREITFEMAVESWYERVYLPLITIIHQQDIMRDFTGRTETDLYMWIISHQWYLRQTLGVDVTPEQAAEEFTRQYLIQQRGTFTGR